MINQYTFPLTIVIYLASSVQMKEMMESVIEDLVELCEKNKDNSEFIPPIVFSPQGRAYNIDYNFLVHCIAWKVCEETIETDFKLSAGTDTERYKRAQYLICSIFENYFGLVRLNSREIDLSKYKTMKKFELPNRSFNIVCIQRGDNIKRFRAVPFNAMKLKNLISEDSYKALDYLANKSYFEQIIFGENRYQEYLRENGGVEIEFVF